MNHTPHSKKKYIVVAVGMLVTLIALTFFLVTFLSSKDYAVSRISHQFTLIEIRDTDAQRQRGLSGRDGLCGHCGMLFVFDGYAQRGFWMKDMKFDIDIIWLRDGRVVHIEQSVPHTTPSKVYQPSTDADMVLELPAGKVQSLGIETDQQLIKL